MSRYYKYNELKLPSVTTIIADCTDKSAPLTQWAANMVCQHIRDCCVHTKVSISVNIPGLPDKDYYEVTEQDLNDARFNFRKVSQEALDTGSEVHDWIETYLKSECYPDFDYKFYYDLKPEVHNAVSAFLGWAEDNNLKPISIEKTVYGNGWAGMLDFFGYLNGKLYVLDWKSSKVIYPEMRYQIAAYRSETPRMKQIDQSDDKENWVETGCGILRLDKETGLPEFKDTSKTYEQDLNVFNKMVELYFARHPIIRKNAGR